MKTVYYSRAYDTPEDLDEKIKQKLINVVGRENVNWYIKGTPYTTEYIEYADVFCIFLSGNRFVRELNSLTAGVKKELEYAISLRKPIILAYYTHAGQNISLYNVLIKHDEISGIPGTSPDVIKFLNGPIEPGFEPLDTLKLEDEKPKRKRVRL